MNKTVKSGPRRTLALLAKDDTLHGGRYADFLAELGRMSSPELAFFSAKLPWLKERADAIALRQRTLE